MKAYRGVDVQIHVFLTSVLVLGDFLTSGSGRFTPGINRIGVWMVARAAEKYEVKSLDFTGHRNPTPSPPSL
jgi:hypothetical protein